MATRLKFWIIGITLFLVIAFAASLRLYAIDRLPPPSLNYDEAFYAVDAIHVLNGQHAIFFPGNNGHEPLYIYLEALMFRVFGISAVSVRVLSALIGILTVLGVYWGASELFGDLGGRNSAIGLLSALALGGLFWHISFSRGGLRVITFPLMSTLAMAMLGRTLRLGHSASLRHRVFLFVATGILLGASLYTYGMVRLLPFVIAAAMLAEACAAGDSRRWLRGLVVVTAVTTLVFAPLGLYFIQHPWTFSGRAEALWDPTHLSDKALGTLAMFFTQGDYDESVNIRGRPALDAVQSAALVVGVVACLVRRPRRRGALVLAWFAIMLFANVLGDHPASFLHAMGSLPPLGIILGVGLATLIQAVARLWQRRSPAAALAGACMVTLLVLGLGYSAHKTYTDYFLRWPRSTDLSLAYETNLSAMGEFIQSLPAQEAVYASPFSEMPPGLAFALQAQDARVRTYEGRSCTVLKDTPGRPLTYVIILSDPHSLPMLRAVLPDGETIKTKHFTAYRATARAPLDLKLQRPVTAVFGDQIQLLGYASQMGTGAGQHTLDIVFYWRALKPIQEPYTVFVHVISPEGQLVAQHDAPPCQASPRTDNWRTDEIIADRVSLTLPESDKSAGWIMRVGWYHSYELERLPVLTDLKNADGAIDLSDALAPGNGNE